MTNELMIVQLVTTAGPLWWGVVLVVSLLIASAVYGERPNGGFAGVLLVGLATFLFLFGDIGAYIRAAFSQPLAVLAVAGGYLAVGLVWGIIRWLLYVREVTNEGRAIPDPKEHLDDLAVWAAYWPWSAAGQLYRLVLRSVWRWTIGRLAGVLDWLTRLLFKREEEE